MEVKLVKLITGEDIIAGVESYQEQYIIVSKPHALAMHPEKGLVLMKFTPYAKTDEVTFDRTSILCILDPQDQIADHYKNMVGAIITPKQGIIV
jgi:non-homologous end joining protein Ku